MGSNDNGTPQRVTVAYVDMPIGRMVGVFAQAIIAFVLALLLTSPIWVVTLGGVAFVGMIALTTCAAVAQH